jgi:hypothetical protein
MPAVDRDPLASSNPHPLVLWIGSNGLHGPDWIT